MSALLSARSAPLSTVLRHPRCRRRPDGAGWCPTRTMASEGAAMSQDQATRGATGEDVSDDVATLLQDGVVGHRGAFSREWAAAMGEDIMTAFEEARSREGGAVGRGPNRYYVEIHPEQLRGFVDLVSHPWVVAVCEAVLGPDYEIVELGFDIPFAGAVHQPWHRDFPMPEVTKKQGVLNSLAFNLTGVDTAQDMGPFEIALGTQCDDEPDFDHGMFPPKERYPSY